MPETDPDVHKHPDRVYREQASYLANHTELSDREAEAYLRSYTAHDDTSQRELAADMGVSESTFSGHLSAATRVLEDGETERRALQTMLSLTRVGGTAGGLTQTVVDATETLNAFVLLTEDGFSIEETLSSTYTLHIVYRDLKSDVDILDDAPDEVIHFDKWSVFSIENTDQDAFLTSIEYYVDNLDALDAFDLHGIFALLSDNGFDADETAEVAAEEALSR